MKLVEWNEALLSDLRRRGRTDRRLYLYVDRETLADASGLDEQQAVDDFCVAFRAARGSRPFAQGARGAERWAARGFEGDPPFVADLSMTVLAVTEEPVGALHGVYRTQNQLLGRPADAQAPEGYGEDVPAMWQVWNRWLEGPGHELGRPSARTHDVWTLQGWSRSQGIVRHRDRLTIEQFVHERGPRVERLDVGELLVWLRFRGGTGANLLARVERDRGASEIAQEVLDDELERWRRDGARETSERPSRGLLLYDDWSDTFCGAVHIDAGLVGDVVSLGDGDTVAVDEHTPTVRVPISGAPSAWLQAGIRHDLTSTRSVTFGGRTAFLFRDEPDLEGRLETDRPASYLPHYVLVHDGRRLEVEAALRASGSAVEFRSACRGWSWFDGVVLTEHAPLLQVLGFDGSTSPAPIDVSLTGGMRLGRAQQYLCGHEPDAVLPYPLARLVVDGTVVGASRAAPPMVRLAELGLSPGEHVVEYGGEQLTFRTLAFIKERAENDAILRPGQREGATWVFADAQQGISDGPGLVGACAVGIAVREPVLLHSPGTDYLVLREDGSLHQVQPLRPRWLGRHGLDAQGLDVDGLASRIDGAAVVLARTRRTGAVVAAKCGSVPRAEETIPLVPRPDVVAALVTGPPWTWVGEPADGLARTLLARALQWKPATSKPKSAAPARHVVTRAGVTEGTRGNPFDEVLTWLSEREHASASREDFMLAWGWVCDKLGRQDLVGDWRRALQTLADLGHVEQDFSRGRVLGAPAVAVALPDANGLYLFSGVRPARVLERLDDPDDPDPVVAGGVALTSLEVRTPVDKAGRPAGPAAIYIAMEPRHVDRVRSAYERLGVRLHGCTARWLLETAPTLDRTLRTGQRFSHAPGSDAHLYAHTQGVWQWVRTHHTDDHGMFRFRQGHRSVFAWRPASGADLVEVEPAAGRWLARRAVERDPVVHERFADRLFVAEELSPPAILRRALTLRSGMPAYEFRCQFVGGRFGARMRAYENVDAGTARRVAEILGVELHSEYDEVKGDHV